MRTYVAHAPSRVTISAMAFSCPLRASHVGIVAVRRKEAVGDMEVDITWDQGGEDK